MTPREPSEAAVEKAAKAMCKSGRYETGQGTCAALCMDQLGDPRKWGCRHAVHVHGKEATAALRAAYAIDRKD